MIFGIASVFYPVMLLNFLITTWLGEAHENAQRHRQLLVNTVYYAEPVKQPSN
jgi:hypothetical protein